MRCTKAPPHRLTPLLLVFVLLCLTAPSWAFHIALDSPTFDHAPTWESQYMHWHVATDGPLDICLGLKKVEYWVDGTKIQEYNWASPNPSVTSHEWTYDGTCRLSGEGHSYTIKVWIYASEFGGIPPMPRTVEKELTPITFYSTIYNGGAVSELYFDDDGNSATVAIEGTLTRGGLTVTVAGQQVQQDGSHHFSEEVSLDEGTNSIEVSVTDSVEGELASNTFSVYRAHLDSELSQTSVDVGTGGSITVTATPEAAALVECRVYDSKGLQFVKTLGETSASADQECTFTWNGTADQPFGQLASNSKVVPGTYRIRVATFGPEDDDGERPPCTADVYEVTVSNTGATCPAWSLVELEKDATGLSLSGDWYGVIEQCCSNAAGIEVMGDYDGQYITYTFSGTQIDIVYPALVGGDDFQVKVDSQVHGTFGPSSSNEVEFNSVYAISGLADTSHTLTITPLPDASGEFHGAVDALRVY